MHGLRIAEILLQALIPMLTEKGIYCCADKVFVTDLESGFFYGDLLNSHIASKEAMELAKVIDCKDISEIDYEDLDIITQITADDIEDLQVEEVHNGYRILEQCIFNGFISDDLIEKYELSGIKRVNYSDEFDETDFPNEPVKDQARLCKYIQNNSEKVREIIKVQELRTVNKLRLPNGKEQLINSKEIREDTLKRYRPAGETEGCFCQMCRSIKSSEYIEVNNILQEPRYYWPEMRITLCLECSKKFEKMRSNETTMERFYKSIKSADVNSDEPIDVKIGTDTIRFTQTHLAQIQEILKTDKK